MTSPATAQMKLQHQYRAFARDEQWACAHCDLAHDTWRRTLVRPLSYAHPALACARTALNICQTRPRGTARTKKVFAKRLTRPPTAGAARCGEARSGGPDSLGPEAARWGLRTSGRNLPARRGTRLGKFRGLGPRKGAEFAGLLCRNPCLPSRPPNLCVFLGHLRSGLLDESSL